MPGARSPVHPYIPNSAPEIKDAMLREIGAADIDELYGAIPERLRLRRPLALEPALRSELELRRHLEAMLARNGSCREALSFLGGGCWQHYVPAVVDEVDQPRRVPDRLLRRELHGSRQAAGALRVREPDRRARRARRREPADLRLGERRRDGALHVWARGRQAAGARAGLDLAGAARRDARLLRAVDRPRARALRRRNRPARPRRAAGSARRRHRVRLRREPRLPRDDRDAGRADREPRPRRGRLPRRRRRSRSRSASSRRRRATAPTSSAASYSPSASTCTTAAASRASSRRPTRSAGWPSTRPS